MTGEFEVDGGTLAKMYGERGDGQSQALAVDNDGKLALGSSAVLGALTDVPADVVEDATARSGISLWKGAKNYLRTLLARLPAALGAGGGLKVDGSGTALPISGAVTNTNLDIALSALRDAITGAAGAAKTLADVVTKLAGGLPSALGAGGGLKVDGSGTALPVSVAPPASLVHGQKTVSNAGTEEALAGSTALTSGVRVKALHANTGWVYVGGNPVTSGTGFVLDAGEEVFLEVDNLTDVYIDVSVNGEGVSYIGS